VATREKFIRSIPLHTKPTTIYHQILKKTSKKYFLAAFKLLFQENNKIPIPNRLKERQEYATKAWYSIHYAIIQDTFLKIEKECPSKFNCIHEDGTYQPLPSNPASDVPPSQEEQPEPKFETFFESHFIHLRIKKPTIVHTKTKF
jgi:hypothetical protein